MHAHMWDGKPVNLGPRQLSETPQHPPPCSPQRQILLLGSTATLGAQEWPKPFTMLTGVVACLKGRIFPTASSLLPRISLGSRPPRAGPGSPCVDGESETFPAGTSDPPAKALLTCLSSKGQPFLSGENRPGAQHRPTICHRNKRALLTLSLFLLYKMEPNCPASFQKLEKREGGPP